VILVKKMPFARPGSLSPEGGEHRGERIGAYAAFLLIGLLLLHALWHWAFNLDPDEAVSSYFVIMLFVPPLAILGCMLAVRLKDPVLRVLVVATAVLVVFEVIRGIVFLPHIAMGVMTSFTLAYAFLCLIAWPVSRLTRGWRPAALILIGLVAMTVPFCLA
jgi:hypothetical protein